jgi:hypothetical protein
MSDPPWRIDPLQTIIRVSPSKKKGQAKDKPDKPPSGETTPPPPGGCGQCGIGGCCLTCCFTCFCPGILCIGPGGCCAPAGCTTIGIIMDGPDPGIGFGGACASGMFVADVVYACCQYDSDCVDVPHYNGGPNFYPVGSVIPTRLPT